MASPVLPCLIRHGPQRVQHIFRDMVKVQKSIPITKISLRDVLAKESQSGDTLYFLRTYAIANPDEISDSRVKNWLDLELWKVISADRVNVVHFLFTNIMQFSRTPFPHASSWRCHVQSEEMAQVLTDHAEGILRRSFYPDMYLEFCIKFGKEKYGAMFLDFMEQNPNHYHGYGPDAQCKILLTSLNENEAVSDRYLRRVIDKYFSRIDYMQIMKALFSSNKGILAMRICQLFAESHDITGSLGNRAGK